MSPNLFTLQGGPKQKILALVEGGSWMGIGVSRGGPILSHLCFADDVLLFREATENQARVLFFCNLRTKGKSFKIIEDYI